MSDKKSFYFILNEKTAGPVCFSSIKARIRLGVLKKSTLIHSGEGDWIPYSEYVAKHPELLQSENTAPTSTPAQICFILAFVLLAIGLAGAVMASNVHMAIGGISSFIFWGIIGLILRAATIQADKRTASIIKAIRELKEE